MDLSKAYDCLQNDLSVAKFEGYGVNEKGSSLKIYYLTNWRECI